MSKILKVVGASWLQTKISSYILGILGILAILALFVGQMERIQEDGNYAATVFYSDKTGYRIEYWGQSNELANIPKGVARAYFRMDIDTEGWSMLEVETDSSYPDEVQAYAAGIVEGALTWSLIHSHLENTIRAKCEQPMQKQCNKLKDALDKSVEVWKSHAAERGNVDPFWHQVSLYYTQISGIYTGWKHGVDRKMVEYETDISELYWLNAVAEVAEIQQKLNLTVDNPAFYNLPDLSSAFIRLTNDTIDGMRTKTIYLAQNAAGSYNSMTRILKRYKLNYHITAKSKSLVQGISIDFSSYPGSITSQDEFYIVKGNNHRMAITGTPLKNYNSKLWKEVNITEQTPIGPRVTTANRLATNISTWAHVLATSNSGTGSKQWLIVDFNKFHNLHTVKYNDTRPPRNEIVTETTVNKTVKHTVVYRDNDGHAKGLVGLLEQVPALTHYFDLSDIVLEQEYFALYGLPYFKDVAEATLVNKMEEVHGRIYSKTESQRALLFKQGYKNATSLEAIIELMRQNNLTAMNRVDNESRECSDETDCLLKERGYWGVLGARGDLVNNYPEAYGVIDTKVVSCAINGTALEFVAVSGPPYTRLPNPNETVPVNKGNIASIYTDQFDDKPSIDGLEIRELVKQQLEEAEQETLELLNRDVVPAFQWSETKFENVTHTRLPDKWAFGSYTPRWSW